MNFSFRDGAMPRCSQLNLFVKNYFPLADFVNLEIVMMSYFHWNLVRNFLVYRISRTLAVPTTCHLAGLLMYTKQVTLLPDISTRRFQRLTTPPRSSFPTQYYRRIYTTVNNNNALLHFRYVQILVRNNYGCKVLFTFLVICLVMKARGELWPLILQKLVRGNEESSPISCTSLFAS